MENQKPKNPKTPEEKIVHYHVARSGKLRGRGQRGRSLFTWAQSTWAQFDDVGGLSIKGTQ